MSMSSSDEDNGYGEKGLLRSSSSSNGPTTRESKAWMVSKRCVSESMDFEELESVMWRKHQLRRFFQDRGNWWTSSRRTVAWKWILVILTGVIIALIGILVQVSVEHLSLWKFSVVESYMADNKFSRGYFSFVSICVLFASISGILCWYEPAAAGSGIPEIKAYLNGVNLNRVVRIKVLFTKVLGMIFSVSSGLPLGKEGPMIHTGSIVGAAVSQGKTLTFGFDTSWTKFQDLRNDRSKRDFVTFGAAAGVAAAFEAPIGGILFTLEEGASFWSTSLTFRSFFCAMMTQLTISIVNELQEAVAEKGSVAQIANGVGGTVQIGIQFGQFADNTFYHTYELVIFIMMGIAGGLMGSCFNYINERVSLFRMKHYNMKWKKFAELLLITALFSTIAFVFPLMYAECTPLPTQTAGWPPSEFQILDYLVQFNCPAGSYNQVASLFMSDSSYAMQMLFHLQESGDYVTFETGPLLLFFIPYFIMAAITAGTFCPAGLFVPTLMAGAAFGRIIGHILNTMAPGHFADSGIYALIGAAAILGGMARMTIAGAVIVLEACGNTYFLLPLMLTFAASRYAGNAINESMYDMQIRLKEMPFLEGSLKTLGLLNYHPVVEIMAFPVVTLNEITRISTVSEILAATTHNGFPVVSKDGHLKGLILRKVLLSLLKHKVISTPVSTSMRGGENVQLAPAATLFHETMERNYPHYPTLEDITLSANEMNSWLDVRSYMDTSPYSINESSSIQRCYRFFRTMGLRHLIVVNGDHQVTGIVTRQDLTEHRLEHHWFQEADNMQKFIHVDVTEPALVNDHMDPPSDKGPGPEGAELSPVGPSAASFAVNRTSQRTIEVNPMTGSFLPTTADISPPPPVPSSSSTSATSRQQRAFKEPKSMKTLS